MTPCTLIAAGPRWACLFLSAMAFTACDSEDLEALDRTMATSPAQLDTCQREPVAAYEKVNTLACYMFDACWLYDRDANRGQVGGDFSRTWQVALGEQKTGTLTLSSLEETSHIISSYFKYVWDAGKGHTEEGYGRLALYPEGNNLALCPQESYPAALSDIKMKINRCTKLPSRTFKIMVRREKADAYGRRYAPLDVACGFYLETDVEQVLAAGTTRQLYLAADGPAEGAEISLPGLELKVNGSAGQCTERTDGRQRCPMKLVPITARDAQD